MDMVSAKRLISVAVLVLAACGSERTSRPPTLDGGTNVHDAGTSSVGFSGPLLEQAGTDRYTCAEARAPAKRANELWTGYTYATTADGTTWFTVIAAIRSDPFSPPDQYEVQLRAIAADGSEMAPVVVAADNGSERRALDAVPADDGLLIVWMEGTTLLAHRVDTTGAIVSGPHTVATLATETRDVRLVAGTSGGLVVWSTFGGGDLAEVWARAIGSDGAPTAAATKFASSSRRFVRIVPEVVRDGDGYAALHANSAADVFDVEFVRLNASGQPRGAPIVLSTTQSGFGFFDNRGALLALDDGFIAAWTEQGDTTNIDDQTWVMIHLARLDAEGQFIGEPVPLMAPELDIDHVEPQLFWFDDQIALTWGRADHIYICAGCVPNHSTKLVLVDAERLVPSSAVATIDSTSTGGGLLSRRHAVVENLVMSASRVVYHVHYDVQDGAFSCVAN